jgi:hypothetical protein
MVSLIVLLTAVMLAMSAYSQIIGAAVIYQKNHAVVMKAAELTNALLLTTGYPIDWGLESTTPSAFGLQNSESGGYSLSPFSLQRLLSPGAPVYYNKTGLWYSNNSLGRGGTLLVPLEEVVNYTTAAKLLGVNGAYGFRLSIMPTLNVSITTANLNPLRLNAEVRGTGLAISGVSLNYFLIRAVPQTGDYPSIQVISGTAQTGSTGSVVLEFSSVDGSQYAFSIVVYANLNGLTGVGYYTHETITDNKITPFVEDLKNRTVLLAHSWDVHNFPPPVAALNFNATFFVLTQGFELRQIPLANSSGVVNSGVVNYGEGHPYARVQIPTQELGILTVAYRWGNNFGIVMMPWGISTLSFSITFGGDSSNADWVATELRQVSVGKILYQVKVVVWSIEGHQLLRYNP